ncbi:MAG TPA: hypothetical protein PK867_01435, partial [Pirellulales bacterium]|nr:hypothetical protein [Pirellulales bacterium]
VQQANVFKIMIIVKKSLFGHRSTLVHGPLGPRRGQIGLEPTTEREMEQHVEPIDVGADQGQYMEMMGDDKATIAVIAKAAGRAWFIKLTGDRSLVERQRDHFKSFVHSLSIGDTTGATDGK